MQISRRTFIATGLAAAASAYANARTSSETPAPESPAAPGEDGSNLWLRYPQIEPDALPHYENRTKSVVIEGNSPTAQAIREETELALNALLGEAKRTAGPDLTDGSILIGTPQTSAAVKAMNLDLAPYGPEGFIIKTMLWNEKNITVIASQGELGALYAAFHWLRLIQTRAPIDNLNIAQKPRLMLRLANHWDNPNGTIERGYAGASIWNWSDLPNKLSPRYKQYARAQASLGINGSVLNNVNADPRFLTPDYLKKIAALADVWRPYGVRVYLSINFASPIALGKLTTADPLDPAVQAWWKKKVDEIYALIPDFGGFLVKANSEGQPGPEDYHRSHADGANLLADALAPHNGSLMWRAFVYSDKIDPDRVKRAYLEFTPLDGKFKPNVLLQTKNGPLDFQPREPFHPLFGAMPKTPTMLEVQPTQEYLGQAKHLVYLGTMWKEVLDADTFARGKGSTVGKVLEGKIHPYALTGAAGVLNTGADPNWCGHDFSQANWYAFGRLAWDHQLTARAIAEEWTRQTWTNDPASVTTIVDLMMASHETFVSYTQPLGLNLMIGGNHYAPQPQKTAGSHVNDRPPTSPGIGFDRTMIGNKAVAQYFPPIRDLFDNLASCPDIYLLWFHRLPWDHKMKSGKTLWQELCGKYNLGAHQAADLGKTWASLSTNIDPQRHAAVTARLSTQARDAAQWRDQILAYFSQFSGQKIVLTP